ncbi:hypothetical protein [Longimicrobium sp.]|uniref:hypothetical protein n=1 Tax=Longimicrobium sp. TaxID=2029185 RepID=UPI003B3B7891
MRSSPLIHDLLELAWVVLFLNLITLLTGVLVSGYVGRPALLLAVAFAALITLTMATAAAANLLMIGVLRLRDRRRRAEASLSKTSP